VKRRVLEKWLLCSSPETASTAPIRTPKSGTAPSCITSSINSTSGNNANNGNNDNFNYVSHDKKDMTEKTKSTGAGT
jgi:hypothetical protein